MARIGYIAVVSAQLSSERQRSFNYRVAEKLVCSDETIGRLEPFNVSVDTRCLDAAQEQNASSTRHLVHAGVGWLGNSWRYITCWRNARGFEIEVENVGAFAVIEEPSSVIVKICRQDSERRTLEEVLLGPPLILALALQDTLCLHASCVDTASGLVAFVGESGHGKSTLAAYLDDFQRSRWRRIADDTLPIAITANPEGETVVGLPQFPQLKLPAAAQGVTAFPAQRELRAVYVLEAPEAGDLVRAEALGPRESTLSLLRHTVAARLFDQDLLTRHLKLTSRIARRVPVRRLIYPRDFELLPDVERSLAADLRLL